MGDMTDTENIALEQLAEDANYAIEQMKEIDRIRYWTTAVTTSRKTSFRVFMADECNKITREAQSYLLSLERGGIIDSPTRELVIDSVMFHNSSIVDLPLMKATIFMVLVSNLLEQDEIKQLHSIIFDQSGVQH